MRVVLICGLIGLLWSCGANEQPQEKEVPQESGPAVVETTEAPYVDPGSDAALIWLEEQAKDTTRGWFENISRPRFIQGLVTRLQDPTAIDQSSLNLCGPATLSYIWIQHQPMRFVRRALELYDKGGFKDGEWNVEGNPEMKADLPFDDRGYPMDPVDWCLLSSIRHCENSGPTKGYNPKNDLELEAYTPPGELIAWFKRLGLPQGDIVKSKDMSLDSLNTLFAQGKDIIWLVDSEQLFYGRDGGLMYRMFGNHYVVMDSPVEIEDGMAVGMTWTWGIKRPYRLPEQEYRQAVKKFLILNWTNETN